MPDKVGAIPSQMIEEWISAGYLIGASSANVRPSSIDLTISAECYRINYVFQLRQFESVRQVLKTVGAVEHPLPAILERGVTYLVKLKESLALPRTVYAYANPKSTTGRNDVHVRMVADHVSRYDAAPTKGYEGELWLLVQPKSYGIIASPDQTLCQLRMFTENTRFNETELETSFNRYELIRDRLGAPIEYGDQTRVSDHDGSVLLTLDLASDIVGWECLGTNKVLDLGAKDHYHPNDFFRPLHPNSEGNLDIRKDGFYILRTYERVRVPPKFACEMVPMDWRAGDFRSHYAGFIDPGWGWGKLGNGTGRPLVLEVRSFDNDLVFRPGQPVAKIRFERMCYEPAHHYDELEESHYAMDTDAPKLARQFRMFNHMEE